MKAALAINSLSEDARKVFELMEGAFPETPFTQSHTLFVGGNRGVGDDSSRDNDIFALIPDRVAAKIKSLHALDQSELLPHASRMVVIFNAMDAEHKHNIDLIDMLDKSSEEFLVSRKINLRPPSLARDHIVQFLVHGNIWLFEPPFYPQGK